MKKLLKLLAFSGTLITCIVGCGNTNTTSNSPSNNTSYETEQATYTNPINVTYSNGSPYTGEIAEIIREGIQKNLGVIGIEKSEKGVYVSCLKSYF